MVHSFIRTSSLKISAVATLSGVRPLLTIFTDIGLGAPLSLGMHNPTTASSAVGLDYIVLFVEEFS